MPAGQDDLPSKGAINRAGQLLVLQSRGGVCDPHDLAEAQRILTDFRTAHSYPLSKVNMGLRSMISSEGGTLPPTQRLKRAPRIIRKLRRMEDSEGHVSLLARLEDVGGCRAVVKDASELQRVHRRIRHRWGTQIRRERDYVSEPKSTGYRAIHVVVERDGRRVEVQLRTIVQQYWADQIELADARLSLTLKDGTGPDEMIEFFAAGGDLQHRTSYGLEVTGDVIARLHSAREAVIRAGFYTG